MNYNRYWFRYSRFRFFRIDVSSPTPALSTSLFHRDGRVWSVNSGRSGDFSQFQNYFHREKKNEYSENDAGRSYHQPRCGIFPWNGCEESDEENGQSQRKQKGSADEDADECAPGSCSSAFTFDFMIIELPAHVVFSS